MNARFLLGPAGSGKTHRCLSEIRRELLAEVEGLPLVLLAPKQATFQVERQLLSDPALPGYTRLHVVSFERLAELVFGRSGLAAPEILTEEARVMVLRALVLRHRGELEVFRSSARFPGFAHQLSLILRELEHHRATPGKLEEAAGRVGSGGRLGAKLRDLGLLRRLYDEWLGTHGLEDGDRLLELAAAALRQTSPRASPHLRLGGLWLDGFAQMTPSERGLLMAVLPFAARATLAFCLETEPTGSEAWYDPWALVGDTYLRCRDALTELLGRPVEVERLGREHGLTRFSGAAELEHLERHWNAPEPYPSPDGGEPASIQAVVCADAEAEAVFVAREILRWVRQEGRRFRDVAVLVRRLDGYHDPIRRVFSRYGIPFFLDRREAVAHHPLAELTRAALRTVWFGWHHDDWFGALKSGLVPADEEDVDRLENVALAAGWEGEDWRGVRRRMREGEALGERLEGVIRQLVAPFIRLERRLTGELPDGAAGPTGAELAAAMRGLWEELEVQRILQGWAGQEDPGARVHATVWEQMQDWLEGLSLAFRAERLRPSEWMPVVESGLAGLTVGVIPPVLDQVLVGAIDRSRNPDLRVAFVLGMNEGVFPAPPADAGLLTDGDREELERTGCGLGPGLRPQLGLERYYGYIACTRARERLVVTLAQRDSEGRTLNPSVFISHLDRLFPGLRPGRFVESGDWRECEHPSELVAPLLRAQAAATAGRGHDAGLVSLADWPVFRPVLDRLRHLHAAAICDRLTVDLAGRLYGETLATSVSRLEQFAMCPFRFFVHSGLGAEERVRYELDTRQQGSFQHEVLARFHEEIRQAGRRWRDLRVDEAQALLGRTAEAVMQTFEGGMLLATERNRFVARGYCESLQRFIGVAVEWMSQYRFDPARVELAFGLPGSELPAWVLELDDGHRLALRGRIDRIDVGSDPARGPIPYVVIDYKSGARRVDRVLTEHGIQMQLPAYLNVVRRLPGMPALLGVPALRPAGVFYVNLRGAVGSAANRREAIDAGEFSQKAAYRHEGLFDFGDLRRLDSRDGLTTGDQFDYRLTAAGTLRKSSTSGLPTSEFEGLLDRQEELLIKLGLRIFSGEVRLDPYRKGQATACDGCAYASVCRIDRWVHVYRRLVASGGGVERVGEEEAEA